MTSIKLIFKICGKHSISRKKKQIAHHIFSWKRTIYTWRGGSGGASHLPRKARALHSLWPLLDFVLVAAAMQCYHFAGACSDMVRCWRNDRKDGIISSGEVVITFMYTHSSGHELSPAWISRLGLYFSLSLLSLSIINKLSVDYQCP